MTVDHRRHANTAQLRHHVTPVLEPAVRRSATRPSRSCVRRTESVGTSRCRSLFDVESGFWALTRRADIPVRQPAPGDLHLDARGVALDPMPARRTAVSRPSS